MRLAVVISSLGGGGLERMRLNLIREWLKQPDIEVDLVVGRRTGELVESIPNGVKVFELAKRGSFFFIAGLRRYVREREPTHVLSAGNDINALTLIALRNLNKRLPIVISVHAHFSTEMKHASVVKKVKLAWVIHVLRRNLTRCRAIVTVSEGIGMDLKRHLPNHSGLIKTIYNPSIGEDIAKLMQEPMRDCPVPESTPWILFAGRFEHQKGLDILINAFALLSQNSEAHLVLMGNGNEETMLKHQIRREGLENRIHWVNFQLNPLPWLKATDVLVLPSRYEGLPNILIEAMACGTQVVASDCDSGPSEILDSGLYGQLVPVEDAEALAQALHNSLVAVFHIESDVLRQRASLFSAKRAAAEYKKTLLGSKK